ncbi:OmpA family protein [Algicola sagamiensis]|uniref:OmpA family protein n=1 Tax=Algicola sagamiensis TaxID=163869 RepID=UPI000A02E11A|nr:OmpA family protein [Algicola sagamiensis]
MTIKPVALFAFAVTQSVVSMGATAFDDPFSVTVFGEYFVPDVDSNNKKEDSFADSGPGLGFEFEYRFMESLGVRLETGMMFLDATSGDDEEGYRYGLDLMYYPGTDPFYLFLGGRYMDIGDAEGAVSLGAGYRFMLTDSLSFNLEGDSYHEVDQSFTHFGLKFGLSYFFGGGYVAPVATPSPVVATEEEPEEESFGEASELSVTPTPPPPTPEPEPEPELELEPEPVTPVFVDSDNDGISDQDDKCADSDERYAVDETGCTRFEEKTETVRLNILFDNNASRVKPHYFHEIARVAGFMDRHPESTVVIHGHTSSVGDDKYNQWLSERRARNVARILITRFRIARDRVDYKGHGESQPLDTSNSPKAHMNNRRIEAVITASRQIEVDR